MATKNGKPKVIAVSMSWDCIKQPRCSFCYLDNISTSHLVMERLKRRNWELDSWMANHRIGEVIKENSDGKNTTVCFEYNGYNLDLIDEKIWWHCGQKVTVTTMPQAVTPILSGFLKHIGVSAVSLSYDSEKVAHPSAWLEKARMIKETGMLVSCNYLIEPGIGLVVPDEVLNYADQLNLLSFKPTGKLSQDGLSKVRAAIEVLKTRIPVVVDNCLGCQLGFIKSCEAGKEFIHILPTGEVTHCCFKDKCFIWKGGEK